MYANLHFLFLMCKRKVVHFSSFRKIIELCVVKKEKIDDTMKGHKQKRILKGKELNRRTT